MSRFPMPVLDDRSFQDIVDEAKRRIPHHTPEWTNHNLSDPGVALIELFAWMTESLGYRLNQVPDRLYRTFLEFVGITPFAARPATAIVTFWAEPDPERRTQRIPVGRRVSTSGDGTDAPVDFLTTAPVEIRQPTLVQMCRGSVAAPEPVDASIQDATASWAAGEELALFPGLQVGETVAFGFALSLAGNVVELEVSAPIRGVGVDPANPPLVWEVSTASGVWTPAESYADEDSTNAFNTDGRVLIRMPSNHSEVRYGETGERAFWVRVRLVDGPHLYTESPRVNRLAFRSVGGMAPVEQGQTVPREELGTAVSRPGQTFRLRQGPVLPRRAHETIEIVGADGVNIAWTEVSDFTASGPDDRHFTIDDATGEVAFGPHVRMSDGSVARHGAVPEEGSRVFMTGYRSGGGSHGNVVAGAINTLRSQIGFVQRMDNRHPATGGVDAESVDNAKLRAPLALASQDRAVTAADFEYLARSTQPWIARVRCQPATIPNEPIQLFVIPESARVERPAYRALLVPDEQLTALARTIDARRLVGTAIEVGPADYRPVSITARVTALPQVDPDRVRAACEAELYRYVHPLTGGVDGEGWQWGETLTRSAVVSLLESVPGVVSVGDLMFFDANFDDAEPYASRSGVGTQDFTMRSSEIAVSATHRVIVRNGRGAVR
ncbi:MAG: putative baseplate assembly protein [Actinomycetota bacterium]